ncbi:MAG: anaerobic ribonucleoside-triphosphate reductase activating protein [Pseudobutyrivibrio sp.]|uniref:anaerobic ribonucleoside-triphosphate reductase activating protein n=1 Tax=Pseudobutyrivibrio sp. TaxID=2014367 RepID=UPI0025EB86A4|nr:anaerobic ribonucleoside-triphosphate reductase activating protein [Pseudobutyrivibrio sp.]MBQ6462653.1 anaerobic ribonucleoside-triphosphate reductase activating protein [Pseudobutyrivibrio sp.]
MLILGLQKTTLLDFPGKVASTIFTGGCNFRCPFCHNSELVFPPKDALSYSLDEIFEHLTSKKKILDGVCITGGEPTLHMDLPDFIKQIKDLGLLVKLDSNGTNPDMLKYLIDNRLVDYIAMDIKTTRAKYNDIACMTNFDIKPIESSISILMEGKIDYEFRTTVMKECHSKDDMQSIGQWLAGAKAYYIQSYKESEQVINPIFSSHSIETLNEFVDILKPYIPNTNLRGVD